MKRFQKGDRVFDIRYGWGTIGDLPPSGYIYVYFDQDKEVSLGYIGENSAILSFTEYTLEGFSSERPKLTWDDVYDEWYRMGDSYNYNDYIKENFEPPVRKCK